MRSRMCAGDVCEKLLASDLTIVNTRYAYVLYGVHPSYAEADDYVLRSDRRSADVESK